MIVLPVPAVHRPSAMALPQPPDSEKTIRKIDIAQVFDTRLCPLPVESFGCFSCFIPSIWDRRENGCTDEEEN